MKESERRYRRAVLRPLFVFAALAAFAVVLVPSGSAKPPPPPAGLDQICLTAGNGSVPCTSWTAGGGDYSILAGANPELQVTVRNDASSNQTLGYATVSVPAGIGISIDTTDSASIPTYKTYASQSTSSMLQLRNLGLAPGSSLTVAFFVNSTSTACTDGQWGFQAQVSNNGFVFSAPTASTGLTSLVPIGCKLAFDHEPTAALQNTTITSAPYNTAGTSVSVVPEDANGDALPVALNGGSVTLSVASGSFDAAGASFTEGGTTPPSESFSGGAATFATLKASATGGPFTLQAHAAGFDTDAVSGPPFAITQNGTPCTSGASCKLTGKDTGGNILVSILTSTGFTFVGSSPFTFPAVPTGCLGWSQTDGVPGFAEFDGRSANGSMTVTYYVPQNAIQARYGKNVGQQFIPICVGARKVDAVTGQPQNCSPEGATDGWTGDQIDPLTGRFTGQPAQAICGADGYYWAIISSFQDKLDQSTNPVVTGWSSGKINGVNYRANVMSVPAGWDYKGGG